MKHSGRPFAFGTVALALLGTACASSNAPEVMLKDIGSLQQEVSVLRAELARTEARGMIENVFNRYQYLHNVFRDEEIIDLWVRKDTPGISAQYTNTGVYTTWDSVMAYHRDRPTPIGKLLIHYSTTPLIEVAADGQTAKGTWTVAGIESGLASPQNAEKAPSAFFEPGLVDGQRVWAHWVFVRYHLDFKLQDGDWKIWHLRVVEITRAPFSKDWISFASILENVPEAGQFHNDILYFGDNGEVVFYPPHDAAPKTTAYSYRTREAMELQPPLPEPYSTFEETHEY